MKETMPKTLKERSDDLFEAARKTHRGVFLTGPSQIEILEDDLPESSFSGEEFLLASLGIVDVRRMQKQFANLILMLVCLPVLIVSLWGMRLYKLFYGHRKDQK